MIKPLSVFLALACSMPAFGADLGHARALVDQRRFAEAITEYETLVAEQPGQPDLLIEAARVHAWADRHPPAATLYQQAIDLAPHRRYDVLLALAWQLAWAGRHEDAIPLFQEVARQIPAQRTEARHGLAESYSATGRLPEALATYRSLTIDPADLKARRGEARLLLWQGRHDEAAQCYRAILAAHPRDKEAQTGLARALNHGGRHFAAVSTYTAMVRDDPGLASDTRVERALALRWAGLEDAALQTLGDAGGKDAGELRGRLVQDVASHLRAELESSWDSDDLDVLALTAGWQQRFGAGHLLDVSVRNATIEQGADRTDGRQLLVRAGTRLGDVERGLVWPTLAVGVRDYEGWQTLAWKLQGKWIPADLWRVDLEAGNEIIENAASLRQEVQLDAVSASADWRFAPLWSTTLGGTVLRFNDDNQRTRLVGRVARVVSVAQPRIALGIEGMGFNDSDPDPASPYYNPRNYRELKALARFEHERAGWLLDARLSVGKLWETPGDGSGLYAWELSAARDLAPMQRLRLYAGGSDSSAFLQGSGSGYTRNYLGASLIWFY